jgi:hypothetical protein
LLQEQCEKQSENGFFEDVADGLLFKDVTADMTITKYTIPFFLGVDGITMDSQRKLSVDPQVLVNMFLPPEDRTKSPFNILVGLTPPNVSNAKIYMQPLLDELSVPFGVWDAVDGKFHKCEPFLLFGVFDLRGMPKLNMGNTAPALFACNKDVIKGVKCAVAKTTVYCGHYRYAPADAANLRKRCFDAMMPTCEVKSADDLPPAKRTKESAVAAGLLADKSNLQPGSKNHPCKLNFQHESCFIAGGLHYWDPVRCIWYDPMHCFMNKGRDWAHFTVIPSSLPSLSLSKCVRSKLFLSLSHFCQVCFVLFNIHYYYYYYFYYYY